MPVTATGFITDAQLKDAVASSLRKTAAALDADVWDDPIAASNLVAYREILGHFLDLGYTKAQIDDWDRGPDFQRGLAQYEVLIKENGDGDQIGEWRTELDYWRKKLEALNQLETSSALVDPTTSTAIIGRGSLKTDTDLFAPNPNDRRRGRVTRW